MDQHQCGDKKGADSHVGTGYGEALVRKVAPPSVFVFAWILQSAAYPWV
jgi:hypothetical protein